MKNKKKIEPHEHIYSRAINQPYPRLCAICGEPEKNEALDKLVKDQLQSKRVEVPADRLKYWNDKLYYQMLDWKDSHPKLYHQATGGLRDSLHQCNEPELLAIAMLTIQQGIK